MCFYHNERSYFDPMWQYFEYFGCMNVLIGYQNLIKSCFFYFNLGKFSRYVLLISAITNFSRLSRLFTRSNHGINPMAYHPCTSDLAIFLNTFLMLRFCSNIFIKTSTQSRKHFPLGRWYISYKHYFYRYYYDIAPNA